MAQVDKQAIAAAFGRAASHYEQHAELQRQSADALLALLAGRECAHVLDAGCGPGRMSRFWREQGCEVTALDLSAQMLDEARRQQAAHHYLTADIEAIPLAAARFDLAWSNLAVQWCGDLRGALSELYRVVRPGGVVAFTSLAHGSLPELRQAWQAVDNRGMPTTFCRRRRSAMQCAAGASVSRSRRSPCGLMMRSARCVRLKALGRRICTRA